MTLDEARAILGVARGASHADIRDAFRHRARLVHPDAHPTVSAAQRNDFARQFDRAREARDILLLLPDAAATPGAATSARPPANRTCRTAASPLHRLPRGVRRAIPRLPPHQRTLRFEEFVQVVDAAGFGAGHRSAPSRNIGRTILWSTVGALSVGVLASVVWTAIAS